MANGKIRSESHIIDQRAVRFVKELIPNTWVTREITPDYGIDLDVELFEYENGSLTTLGEHVYLQIKGTTHANYGKYSVPRCSGKRIDVLRFSLDTALLRLVERIGNSFPVLLVVVDLNANSAFYVCLNDYIDYVIMPNSIDIRTQKHVTIYLPLENRIDSARQIMSWYSIRPKYLAFFARTMTAYHDASYCPEVNDYIEHSIRYFQSIAEADVWRDILERPRVFSICKRTLMEILEDGSTERSRSFLSCLGEFVDCEKYTHITREQACQFMSCNELFELINNISSMFHSEWRQLYLPTEYQMFVTEE